MKRGARNRVYGTFKKRCRKPVKSKAKSVWRVKDPNGHMREYEEDDDA